MPDTERATWFLAQFKPNSHNIAARNLTRQGFRTFLPLQEETRRSRGRFTTQLRPLFPGYLFVALHIAAGHWRAVNATHGITRLVSLGKEPTPVPQDLVTELMQRHDAAGRLIAERQLQPGDPVIVTKGPFASFAATIESIAPDRRVYVLMDLMGAKTKVQVRAEALAAV
jgi:transcriptional antiterminator RfaH